MQIKIQHNSSPLNVDNADNNSSPINADNNSSPLNANNKKTICHLKMQITIRHLLKQNLMNLQPEPPNLISTEKFHRIKCSILSSCIGNAQNIMNLQPSPHLKVLPQKLQQQPEPPNSISTEKFHHIKCSIWAVALEMRRTLWTFNLNLRASSPPKSFKTKSAIFWAVALEMHRTLWTVALCSLEENLSFKVNFTVKISVHY